MKDITIGDWVNSYGKGIFRIENIIICFYEESSVLMDGAKIGDPMPHRTITTKRFLNSKYKKAINYESCSEYFINPLDDEQRATLDKVLAENPRWLTELDAYTIPTQQSIHNSDLQIDNESDLQAILGLVDFVKQGKSYLEIQTEMKRLYLLRLKPKHYGNYRFQLVNYDEEYKDKRLVYREATLTKS